MTADDVMKGFRAVRIGRSGVAELIGLSLFGLFLAAIAAYDGEGVPARVRYPYWQLAMVGGGVIAALIEPGVARLFPGRPRAFVLAQLIAMTPPISLWVSIIPALFFGRPSMLPHLLWLMPSVLTINVAVVGLAWLTRSAFNRPLTQVSAPEGLAPPALRGRLPPRLARARLIAVEAEDHYLRIRTEVGSTLVLMRLADALAALEGADGFRVHRSWWVARSGVEAARWKAGRGELTLSDGAVAPVSRTYAAALRGTDWAAPAA
ncbi:LytTR family DNA-binding domain-containing protein [Brevundimonas sp.]|uniref:LytTR family DNA-binding domain-containing protein n=1 Tax=Brevundimonas sp. TaxID=1871086 RepID=UPI002EDAAC9E